jgi:hypothetical protein
MWNCHNPVGKDDMEGTFTLPEKWYIVVDEENKEYCKKLKNKELKLEEGYDYSIGGFYSGIKNCPGKYSSTTPEQIGFIRISFKQFKKYVVEGYKEPKPKKQSYKYLVKILKNIK